METIRKPFQGVTNIIMFNWHFYVISILIFIILFCFINFKVISFIFLTPILTSLFISYYIYDVSNLYTLNWLDKLNINSGEFVNIHAGFDETSILIQDKYKNSNLTICDFYDAKIHTEISIKRARKRYKSNSKTIKIKTNELPFKKKSISTIFILFSAHEIRNQQERDIFFKELHRIIKPNGNLIITEHLRDIANFIAYNIGFLHFLPKKTWLKTFKKSNFKIEKQIKITPFITTYKLSKNGTTS